MIHYFITLPDVVFPENRFCAKCGEYLTHSNHMHARECPCLKCQQERLLTKHAPDAGAVCRSQTFIKAVTLSARTVSPSEPQRR